MVLEVGLGGELDSTNVLDETSLSILTSVQLDHVRQLGSTVEEIAVQEGWDYQEGSACAAWAWNPFKSYSRTRRGHAVPLPSNFATC